MSYPNNRAGGDVSPGALEERYSAARERLERQQRLERGQSGAPLYAALAYGQILEDRSGFRTVSHLAMLLCIAAVFVIPNLLIIHILL